MRRRKIEVNEHGSFSRGRHLLYFLVGLLKIRLKSLHQKWTQHTKSRMRCIRDFYRFTFSEK